jgi:hypothetical protein
VSWGTKAEGCDYRQQLFQGLLWPADRGWLCHQGMTLMSLCCHHLVHSCYTPGVESCPSCGPPSSSSLDPSAPYLVMPDADVLSHYLDVWELPELTNWVLCTSVMRRVSRRQAAMQSSCPDRL